MIRLPSVGFGSGLLVGVIGGFSENDEIAEDFHSLSRVEDQEPTRFSETKNMCSYNYLFIVRKQESRVQEKCATEAEQTLNRTFFKVLSEVSAVVSGHHVSLGGSLSVNALSNHVNGFKIIFLLFQFLPVWLVCRKGSLQPAGSQRFCKSHLKAYSQYICCQQGKKKSPCIYA